MATQTATKKNKALVKKLKELWPQLSERGKNQLLKYSEALCAVSEGTATKTQKAYLRRWDRKIEEPRREES